VCACARGVRAHEGELELRGISQIEELADKASASGAYGDEDWGGYAIAAGAAPGGHSEAPDYERLEGAQRVSKVRFRVRFRVGT
jgi:hypothetical protein